MFNPILFYESGKLRKEFVSVWDTTKIIVGSSNTNQIKFNLGSSGVYNFVVYWGDGLRDHIEIYNQTETTHTYSTSGIYQVRVKGILFGFAFNNTVDRLKISEVLDWGELYFVENGQFQGCANLKLGSTVGIPKFVYGLLNAFRGCTSLIKIRNFENWDFSLVNSAAACFLGATKFNQPLIGLNFSNCLSMSAMFNGATSFNQDISSWVFNKNVILTGFMLGKSSANYNATYYDNLLIKWASVFIGTGRTETNKVIQMGSIKYTSAGASARASLVADGWTITDGGMI